MTGLTPGMRRVLELMARAEDEGRHEEAELVCEGIECWVGLARTNRAVVRLLLRSLLVRDVSDTGGIERYAVNDTGRAALRRPAVVDEVAQTLARGVPFTVVDDRVVEMA